MFLYTRPNPYGRRGWLGIRTRVNATLIVAFLIGLVASCVVAYYAEFQHAHEEVMLRARLLLESARSVRGYIGDQVQPLLSPPHSADFIMQSSPSFGARETFGILRKTYPDYSYREAALNPTNSADRALSWETDLIERFSRDSNLTELVGEHVDSGNSFLYIADPIRITDPACLACHSTPDAAPKGMIDRYGAAGGFGWQVGQVVGTQIVSVPIRVATDRATESFLLFTLLIAAVFSLILVIVNVTMQRYVIAPLQAFSSAADRMSRGEGSDLAIDQPVQEIAILGQSINRLYRSFRTALSFGRKEND
jgi:protein-histidine pros-kinase